MNYVKIGVLLIHNNNRRVVN